MKMHIPFTIEKEKAQFNGKAYIWVFKVVTTSNSKVSVQSFLEVRTCPSTADCESFLNTMAIVPVCRNNKWND